MAEDFGLGELKKTGEETKPQPKFTDEAIEAKIKEAEESAKTAVSEFNCMVIGKDGTGKSGIVLDYCSKLPKKTLVIDIDGGVMPLKIKHYKDNEKIVVVHPLVQESGEEVRINYKDTISLIRGYMKHVSEHPDRYSAIVLDGISTLLILCEYQMRVDRNLQADGGVSTRYWINRMRLFMETLEAMKSIPIDKFYIGHEDFILLNESASVKKKANASMHQRIICKKIEDTAQGTQFVAKVDKSKYNILKEGVDIVFAKSADGKFTWEGSKVFEGLK